MRRPFTTTLDEKALKDLKKLAIDLDLSVNVLLEEAIDWLLNEKYAGGDQDPAPKRDRQSKLF